MKTSGKFSAGTSGLVLAEPNKLYFPQEFKDKSRLTYYASQFNSIEINSSFYKMPRCQTYKNWSDMVPQDFQFTVKLWRGITHEEKYNKLDLETFIAAINCLGDKKGCLLIQFPAKTTMGFKLFRKLLRALKKSDPDESWRMAVEFRHPKWYKKDIYEVLNENRVSLVLHDMPKSITPELNNGAPFVYLRFHGVKGDYRGSYEDSVLKLRADEIRHWLKAGKDVYVYFNNTIGAAVANLKTLKQMIG